MTTALWMTTVQVAAESGRHQESVLQALHRGLLEGSQAHIHARWRIRRRDFDEWMGLGAPIDDPLKARLRRSA